MNYSSTRGCAHRRSGFSLIELMIAMLAGTFAIMGIYYLGGVSARAFHEQSRVSETQMALRGAMEQIRRDFTRAGFQGTRNASWLRACNATPPNGMAPLPQVAAQQIQAIQITPQGTGAAGIDAAVAALLDPDNNPTRVDLVRLWGNYTTSEAYLIDSNLSCTSPTQFCFQNGPESFRRSFVNPDPGGAADPVLGYDAARFTNAFQNAWVRIETKGRMLFRAVTAVQSAMTAAVGPSISIDPAGAIPPECYTGQDIIVSPLNLIEYAVVDLDGADIGKLAVNGGAGAVAGADRAVLVRRQINIATNAVIANTERIVLDYAVEFSVDGIVNTTAPGPAVPVFAYVPVGNLLAVSQNTPEQLRAVRVTLSARTPEADPRIPRVARPNATNANGFLTTPFQAFRVPSGEPGQEPWARVRTMRTEIFLPNTLSP